MNQPAYILEPGTRIRTHATLESAADIVAPTAQLWARRGDTDGIITGVVPGHGGDVYWVRHETMGTVAPYCYREFDLDSGVRR